MNTQHASLGNCALSTLLSLVVSVFTLTGQAKAQCQYDVTVLQFPIDCGIGTVITSGLSLNENSHLWRHQVGEIRHGPVLPEKAVGDIGIAIDIP